MAPRDPAPGDHHAHDREAISRRRQVTTDRLMSRVHDAGQVLEPRDRAELLNQVIEINTPVAHRIARRFQGRGCSLEDLEQTACLALVRAVHQFDPTAGFHFMSYVVPCISGEVKRHFRDLGWMVRPPRPVQELQVLVERERFRADPHSGRSPGEVEIAGRLDVPVGAVREALQVRGCFTPSSLDSPMLGTEHISMAETLVDPATASSYGAAEARVILAPALAVLAPRDRDLVQMRFVDGLTQRDIGLHLGVSQSQVSRLLRQVLQRLRSLVDEPALDQRETAA